MYIIELSVEIYNMKLDQLYTYLSLDKVYVGQRVLINFNKRNLVGFIMKVNETKLSKEEIETKYNYKLKYIESIIDQEAILNDELIDLAKYMHINTVSSLISCLNTILPVNLKSKSTKQKIIYEKWIRKTNTPTTNLTNKQKIALESFHKEIIYSEFRNNYMGVYKKLLELNYIEIFSKEKSYNIIEKNKFKPLPKLNEEQHNALTQLSANNKVALIHGVTGSGKTEVYLSYSLEIINKNKQVFILVPEISLTTQMIKRVTSLFQNDVAIYHSGLSNNEKYEQYLKVKNNEVKIVVGTRSSIFLPFNHIGLIVIDEEHDSSYKQDNSPCYNTIDIAIKRCEYHNAKLILGSATPSLLTYSKAIKGIYDLIELKQRVFKFNPVIEISNTKQASFNKENIIITNKLYDGIKDTLANNKQVIILLNRRGYYPILKCNYCNQTIICPKCDIALNYHNDTKNLLCHMCNFEIKGLYTCTKCNGNKFSTYGFGTQKVESQLIQMFPKAKIARMDADTVKYKNAHNDIINKFTNKEYDILIGTQMIAKGLDFKDVTLVGILNADSALNHTDYRSGENVYNLITQASGRSGRHLPGKVIIQVENSEHYIIKACINNNYSLYYNKEMNYRHALMYPPYSYLCAIYINDYEELKCINSINFIKEKCIQYNLNYYKPVKLHRINNINRYRLLIKNMNLEDMKTKVYIIVKEYYNYHNSNIKVDINPYNLG